MIDNTYKHSVILNPEKCKGCTTCLKRCPTEAIRIRDGRSHINSERCIDCGECIRVCHYKAKTSVCDKFADIPKNKWKIALPAPSLYGQFDNLDDVDFVLQGLLDIGFDDVFEVARAAEIVTDYTRRYMKRTDIPKPVISSACPVVVRLISLRFPFLCDHVLPIAPPIEIAAQKAREEALAKHPELKSDDIAIVFISPCPAKVSYVKNLQLRNETDVDYVISIKDIYLDLLNAMKKEESPDSFSSSGMVGIGWATSGGESKALLNDKYLAADGIENVMKVIEDIDNGLISDVSFIELNACTAGCVGGAMTVINPFIAEARLSMLKRFLPVSKNWADDPRDDSDIPGSYLKEAPVYSPVSKLDDNMNEAMRMMNEIESLAKTLPAIDCGSCGAPNCNAFASDVVKGLANINDCTVIMREKFKQIEHENKNSKE